MISYFIISVGFMLSESGISFSRYVVIAIELLSGLNTVNSYRVATPLLAIPLLTPLIATIVS
jgi:hypothetical protein